MRTSLKIFSCLLLFTAFLTACNWGDDDGGQKGGGGEPHPIAHGKRTVIVYMSAENNLSTYAQDDINEMIIGMRNVSTDNRLLIYVDRSSIRETPFIACITGNTENPVDTLYKYATDFYSSDADKFQEVLSRAIALCPANSYGLVLWGHANGWVIEENPTETAPSQSPRRAYGVDNGQNNLLQQGPYGRWMNIPDMAKALQQLGVAWKFIFSDCCNMQSVEVAYELKDVAEYLIGSPAEITGSGAPYNTVVKDLFADTDTTMYKAVCDDYNAQLDYVNGHLPISVIKTSELDQLLAATGNVLDAVDHYIRQDNAMKEMIYYFSYDRSDTKEKLMFDMQDVVKVALRNLPDDYDSWQQAFDRAVVYSRKSSYWHANTIRNSDFTATAERQGVVSMFFPLQQYESTGYKYNELIKQMKWYNAIGWSQLGY